jgi:hypothetical protein
MKNKPITIVRSFVYKYIYIGRENDKPILPGDGQWCDIMIIKDEDEDNGE